MTFRPAPALSDLAALAALDDPTRRRLYDIVSRSDVPVGRDEAAAAAGIARSLAAYHLDRLAEHGLVEISYGRPDGRGGPGAGRPAKLYRRTEREFVARSPSRDYGLLAEILLTAAEDAGAAEPAGIEQAARELGNRIGGALRPLSPAEALRTRGYEPFDAGDGALRFANCPFHAAAASHRGLVCGLNLALVEGVLSGLGGEATALLEPDRAGCCVAVRSVAPGAR